MAHPKRKAATRRTANTSTWNVASASKAVLNHSSISRPPGRCRPGARPGRIGGGVEKTAQLLVANERAALGDAVAGLGLALQEDAALGAVTAQAILAALVRRRLVVNVQPRRVEVDAADKVGVAQRGV